MKLRILLILLFSFILFRNAVLAAETEPNNTPAQANVLPLNGSNTGVINPTGDVDWYKVTTTSDGQLSITLTPTSGKYMWVYLYDNNGAIQLNSGNANATFTVSADGLAAGTYYVQVNTYYNTDTSSYTISSSLTTVAQANDAEPDSTRALALTLPLNSKTTGHIDYYYNNHRDSADWYKITTTGDGLLKLSLTSNNGQYIWAYLYDNDGVTVLNSSNTNGTFDINTDGLAAGTYYVRINTYYNTGFAPYTLADTLYKPAQANDAEPDSTKAQSLILPLNGSVTGHIDYYYNNHRDSADWYKVTTTADGLLRLRLTSNNGQYVWAYLYDNDGVTQLNSSNTNGTVDISSDGLAAGTYYVRVNSYYNNGFEPYTLADSLFTPAQANDTEPDSTKALALMLPVNSSTTGHIDYYYNNHRDTSDWYKITLPQDGYLRLRLTSGNGQYIWAYLFDNDGTTLLNSSNTNGTADVTTDGLAAGTYYVRINSYYNNGFEPYTLADSLFTYNANDTVPNQYFSQAVTIPANRTVTGHVDFYYNNIRDTTDTWKINYTGTSGNLNLTFNMQAHIGDGSLNYLWFQIFKDTTAAPIFSNNYATATTPISLTGLSQGYYYIKVFAYYNGQFNAYSIADAFTQVNIAAATVKSTRPSVDSCSGNSITYALSGSHSPYGVQLYHNGVRYDSVNVVSDTARFNNLPTGNYYATVYGDGATDAAFGTSPVTVFLPPTPKGLTTSNILVHTAQLNWTPYSCVKSYSIQYRPSSSTTWTTLSDANDAIGKYTLSGLTMYTNYTWRVASVDTAQGVTLTGAYSDTLLFKTLSDTAIITLTKVTAGTTCNSSSIKYTSTHSVAPYTLQLYRNGAVYGSPVSSTDTTLFTGLPAGIYYATSSGTGSGGSFGTSVMDTILPPAPVGLVTTAVAIHSATLNWTPLSCEHNYIIEYHAAGALTWSMINSFGNTTGTYALTGLSTYTSYEWRIASVDSAEGNQLISLYSDSLMFITLSDTAHIVKASKTQGTTCSSSSIVYNLTNSINPYTVQLYRYGTSYGSPVQTTGTATFTSLPSGVYYATATGTGSGGNMGTSGLDTITPPVPSGLDTTLITATSAQIKWSPISCVKYFTIQYKVAGAATWTTISTMGDVSTDSLTGLLPATKYVFQIASVDSANGYVLSSIYSVTDTFTTHSVLPVTLIKFAAIPVNNTVQISWQTANETNSKSFTVLRSADGITFTAIGSVSAFGNTSLQHQYSFIDHSPVSGTSYYRLRQVDNDGHFTDSKTVTVSFMGTSLFTLYPNPAVSTVHISFSSSSAAVLSVYDMNGKAVMQKTFDSGSGSQTINVSSLAAGTYTVILWQDKQQQSLKFIKQ